MDLILFGRQGSGKGTQGKFLAERYNLMPFVTGNELRRLAKDDSPLGKKVKSIIEAGDLVPNEVVMEIIEAFMENLPEGTGGILFDGIPRQMEQAYTFNKLMEKHGRDYMGVLYEIGNETAIERLKSRAEIEGRADDADMEIVKNRLQTYEQKTVPVIEAYKADHKIVEINGEDTVENIRDHGFERLDPLFNA